MERIPAGLCLPACAARFLALLILSVTLQASAQQCPIAPSSGQPACEVSLDVGSTVPDAAVSDHVGNPIDVLSGNKYQSETDIRLGGSALQLVRHYNSQQTHVNLGLGNGWRHSYAVVLMAIGQDERQIVQSDGRLIRFERKGERFLPLHAGDGFLLGAAQNRHLWQLPDGRRLEFSGSYLTRILMGNGNTLSLFYRNGRVARVTDQGNRQLRFHYAAGEVGLPAYEDAGGPGVPAGHLESVELPDGSRVFYEYDGRHNLTAVEYPSGEPQDKARYYRYEDPSDTGLLTERVDGTGRVLGRWGYDQYGRAISYRRGLALLPSGAGKPRQPTIGLQYSADTGGASGTTQVRYATGERREYHWTLDDHGRIQSVRRQDVQQDEHEAIEQEAANAPFEPQTTGEIVQRYPHDSLTILSQDAWGYPSELEYVQQRNGSVHRLVSRYDQTGRLMEVSWQSGTLEGLNNDQAMTRADVEDQLQQYRQSREGAETILDLLAGTGYVESLASTFLQQAEGDLTPGRVIHGEEFDEVVYSRSPSAESPVLRSRRFGSGGEDSAEPCIDPLRDCETLLRTRDYAEVAECAYIDAACRTRYSEADLDLFDLQLSDLHRGSFHADIFYDADNDEYIVTFAGTDFTSASDWTNNLLQELGLSSSQYRQAVTLARRMLVNNPDANVTFVGHSLGGGLATAAAAAVGGSATVFNPAALDPGSARRLGVSYENAGEGTQIYSVDEELLSQVQTGIGFSNEPPGTMNVLTRPSFDWVQERVPDNPYALYSTRVGVVLHGMEAVNQSLNEAIERHNCI